MSGVETWLHSIIAVILFAVIVELLLPNSKFLKYTRLVIGLILLLTMMSPIIKLFEQDYIAQIDASYVMWEQQLQGVEQSTLSLRDIQAKAEDIQHKREIQALKLTERSIEQQMQEQLVEAGFTTIKNIVIRMELQAAGDNNKPLIKHVKVFISASQGEPNNEQMLEQSEIIEISPVQIEIVNEEAQGNQEDSREEAGSRIYSADEQQIIALLQRSWNLNINQISIVLVDAEKR